MQRNFGKSVRKNRIEDVQVAGFNVDLRKIFGNHEWQVGADGQYNFLSSTAFNYNIETGERKGGLDTRYPDGKNTMSYTGAYTQYLYKLIPKKFILNAGARVNYVQLQSHFVDTAIMHFPFTEAHQKNTTYSGDIGLVYLPDNKSKLSLNFSTGFRAPNIDDLGKVFDTERGTQLVVPNPDVQPEQTFNIDLGIYKKIGNWLTLDLTGFYTLMRNAIVLDKFTLNGKSVVEYDGVSTQVMANQNKAKANIYGFNALVSLQPINNIRLNSSLNYTKGTYEGIGSVKTPLDHIAPLYGKTEIIYTHNKWTVQLYSLYNAAKKLKDYSPSGEDNLSYATPDGMPAWMTMNVAVGYNVSKQLNIRTALENIMDKNYRTFASGISAPGRNFVVKANLNL